MVLQRKIVGDAYIYFPLQKCDPMLGVIPIGQKDRRLRYLF